MLSLPHKSRRLRRGHTFLQHPGETQTLNYLKDGCKYTDVFKRSLSLRAKQQDKGRKWSWRWWQQAKELVFLYLTSQQTEWNGGWSISHVYSQPEGQVRTGTGGTGTNPLQPLWPQKAPGGSQHTPDVQFCFPGPCNVASLGGLCPITVVSPSRAGLHEPGATTTGSGRSLPEENPEPQWVPRSLVRLRWYLPALWGLTLPMRHTVLSLQCKSMWLLVGFDSVLAAPVCYLPKIFLGLEGQTQSTSRDQGSCFNGNTCQI